MRWRVQVMRQIFDRPSFVSYPILPSNQYHDPLDLTREKKMTPGTHILAPRERAPGSWWNEERTLPYYSREKKNMSFFPVLVSKLV
jgi:hypothetical protein